jgi:uncharacterized LabA/DUF88 family protein
MIQLQKTIFFLDFANINRAANDKNIQLDYKHLKEYMGFQRELLDAYCYVPIDPRNEHKYDRDIEELQKAGYFTTTKIGTYAGDTYKCDFDVEMAIDITKMAHVIRPDIVVLATGDSDFVPVVNELRKMGIRVEVAAFNSSLSKLLQLKASSYIDLDVYYRENYLDNEIEEENEVEEESMEDSNTLPIPDEEIEIAAEVLEDEGLETYVFEQNRRYTIAKDNEVIRQTVEVIREFQNENGTYVIYHTEDYAPNQNQEQNNNTNN